MIGLGRPSRAAGEQVSARDPWRRVLVGSLVAMVLLVLALAATGLWLTWRYEPRPFGGSEQLAVGVHRSAATLLQAVVLLAVVAAAGTSYRVGRRTWVAPAGLLVLVLAASWTGAGAAFEQVGLSAVTVADDLGGAWGAAFDEGVRFVFVDGGEVSQATYRRSLLTHLALGGAVVAGLALVARRALRGGDDG